MGIIFNLFVLSIGGIFGSVYLNKRYEEMMPMSVMIIIFILFIFYMLNIPLIGFYLIHFINYILLIMSARKFYRDKDKRKEYIGNFFTPGLLIFGIVVFLIYLATKGNYVMLFDELRMWGAYPKSIFITNKLMIGENLFFSTEYYPGMPLFQYFFARNYGSFVEAHLYISYGIAVLSLLIPITKKITWKKFWLIIPSILFLYTFPALFANSGFDALFYYNALYIDPALGMFFGFSLYLSTKKTKNNLFLYILFCLSLSMIVLMKIVGIVLAALVLLSYFLHQWLIHKDFSFKLKSSYKHLIIPIIILVFTFFSWQITFSSKNNSDVQNTNSSRVNDAIQLFVKPNNKQKEFAKEYINHIFNTTILINDNKVYNKYTISNITIFFSLCIILLLFSINNKSRKNVLLSLFVGVFSVVVFLIFYLYIYVFTFNYAILCYERYLSTVIIGLSFFTIMLIYDNSRNIKYQSVYNFLISGLLLVYAFNIPKISNVEYYKEFKNISDSLSSKLLSKLGSNNEEIKLMTVYNYCDGVGYTCVLYQHQLYLSLMDDNINVKSSGIYVANPIIPSFYIPINNTNLNDRIREFDYVLIVEDLITPSNEDKKVLNEEVKSGTLLKVIIEKDDYKLTKIE